MNDVDYISELSHALLRIADKADDGAMAGGLDETAALEDISDIARDALEPRLAQKEQKNV